MANKFICVEYDKFTNKRETSMDSMDLLVEYEYYFKINLRHVSTPKSEDLLLDLLYRGEDWFYLNKGKLIININDVENIVLEPHESYSDMTKIGFELDEKCEESDWYVISQDILKKICDAKSVDFQIRGESIVEVNANKFIKYAQVFYNGFYNEEAYKEVLEEKLDYISPAEDDEDDDNSANGETTGTTIILSYAPHR